MKNSKKTLSIAEVLEAARSGRPILKIRLLDASRYIGNSHRPLDWHTDSWLRKYPIMESDSDEIVTIGRKTQNISMISRNLSVLKGRGEVAVWIGGESSMRHGELVD